MATGKGGKKGGRKSTKKNGSKNGDNKLAHPDGLTDAISVGIAAGGSGTASGQEAARRAEGTDDNIPQGKDRGSTNDPGEVPGKTGDLVGDPHPPVGPQTEAAIFVPNGAIERNMVASPSGPVPVAAVTSSAEEAEKLIEKRNEDLSKQFKGFKRGKRLSDVQINQMNGAELRAVATDRGYDISHSAGTRGTRAAFAQLQSEDDLLEEADEA